MLVYYHVLSKKLAVSIFIIVANTGDEFIQRTVILASFFAYSNGSSSSNDELEEDVSG